MLERTIKHNLVGTFLFAEGQLDGDVRLLTGCHVRSTLVVQPNLAAEHNRIQDVVVVAVYSNGNRFRPCEADT